MFDFYRYYDTTTKDLEENHLIQKSGYARRNEEDIKVTEKKLLLQGYGTEETDDLEGNSLRRCVGKTKLFVLYNASNGSSLARS
jgi:hypothetical protein